MLTVMQQSWKDIGVDATPKLIQFPAASSADREPFAPSTSSWSGSTDIDPEKRRFHSRNTAQAGSTAPLQERPGRQHPGPGDRHPGQNSASSSTLSSRHHVGRGAVPDIPVNTGIYV